MSSSASEPRIRPASAEDLPRVSSFLANSMPLRGDPARYERILTPKWRRDAEQIGFLIEDDARIGGFVGTLDSERVIRARSEKFCNITSWAVDAQYRSMSLHLLNAALKRKDVTYTCFSPGDRTLEALRFFKFQVADSSKLLLFPPTGVGGLLWRGGASVVTRREQLRAELPDGERKILMDHDLPGCVHLLLTKGRRSCYVVAIRRGKPLMAYADILHASDPELLVEEFTRAWPLIALRARTPVVALDRRFFEHAPLASKTFRRMSPVVYRSPRLGPRDIDGLYSELVTIYG